MKMKLIAGLALGALMAIVPQAIAEDDPAPTKVLVKDFDFTFSPDGKLTAYYSYRDDALPDIYVRPHGGAEKNLTAREDTWDIEPDFSPDGKQIIYSSGISMAQMSLRIMNADGSGDREFYNGPDNEVGSMWSPDGSKIAFTAFNMAKKTADIFVINADGSGLKNLTADMTGGAMSPGWSPDGQTIAFSHQETEEDPADIFVMQSDGSRKRQVTNDAISKMGTLFSADGKMIIFSGSVDGGANDLYMIPTEGGHHGAKAVQLTNTPEMHEYFATFTPDGGHLVFSQGDWTNGFGFAHMHSPNPGGH